MKKVSAFRHAHIVKSVKSMTIINNPAEHIEFSNRVMLSHKEDFAMGFRINGKERVINGSISIRGKKFFLNTDFIPFECGYNYLDNLIRSLYDMAWGV